MHEAVIGPDVCNVSTPDSVWTLRIKLFIKVIYTINAIESLNSTYSKLNRQRCVFPSDKALLKALYLSTFEATKKWTTTLRNWAQVYGELSIMYEDRLPE